MTYSAIEWLCRLRIFFLKLLNAIIIVLGHCKCTFFSHSDIMTLVIMAPFILWIPICSYGSPEGQNKTILLPTHMLTVTRLHINMAINRDNLKSRRISKIEKGKISQMWRSENKWNDCTYEKIILMRGKKNSAMTVLSHPGHGKSRCRIVGNWTSFSFLKMCHLSHPRDSN